MDFEVIYSARGSNRSWEWLAMVSVSIFTLRDVIRRMQIEFKIPYNGKSHTSPSTADDIHTLRCYLESHKLQEYHPERTGNKFATAARDLLSAGMEYTNKANAFKSFIRDSRKAVNKGVQSARPQAHGNGDESEDDGVDHDFGHDVDVGLDDLAMDEEEFPPFVDPHDFVEMAREFIHELVRGLSHDSIEANITDLLNL